MATFVGRAQTTTTSNLTPHSNYGLIVRSPINVPDGVYRVGDPVPVFISSNTAIPTTLVGYEQGTNYPIFDRVGALQFYILFPTTNPGGSSYDPGGESDIIRESFAIGGPIAFADFGLRGDGTTLYASQGQEIEFDRAVYEVNGAATLRIITSRDADGSPNYGQTIQTTFNGLDPETGNPIFTPTGTSSSYNGGRHIVAASVRDPAGYTIPTSSIVAEAWPPEVTFSNYGVRQGADIDNDVDFDLQADGPGFVGLDIPAGAYRAGDTLTIRVFGGVGDGESVEVKYLGLHNRSSYQYPVFETDDFNGQRTQFIGTRELNTQDTYDPSGNLATSEGFATGVATFADYGLRIPEGDGDTNVLNSQDREIEFDYEDLRPDENIRLRIYRMSGGQRVFQEEVQAQYAGFDRETGDPIFNPQGWRGNRQILAASEKQTTYTVPHGDDVDDGDGTVEDRTGGDIIAEAWPPVAIDNTYTNYGFRQGDLTADFDLQGTGPFSGLDVPFGVYRAGDILTIRPAGGEGGGAPVEVTFVGYVVGFNNARYPIFEAADFDSDGDSTGDGRAQFIGTTEPDSIDTYAANTIITDQPLGVGRATFTDYGLRDGTTDNFESQGGGIDFDQGVYTVGQSVTLRLISGQNANGDPTYSNAFPATFLGLDRRTGDPVFDPPSDVLSDRDIIAFSDPSGDYTLSEIINVAWSTKPVDATFSNYGLRQGSAITSNGAFELQGTGPFSGLDVPGGIYSKDNTLTIEPHQGDAGGAPVDVTFVGYVADDSGTNYPVFEAASFNGQRTQFIGTNELDATATYTAGTIVDDTQLGIGDATFSAWAINTDPNGDTFNVTNGVASFPYAVYDSQNNAVMFRLNDGTPQSATYVGYERGSGFPVFQYQFGGFQTRQIMMLSATTEDNFEAADILNEAWPAASLDASFSNFGFRQAANLQDLATMEFDLRGAGIDVPNNVYTPNTENANDVEIRFFGGGYAGLSEELKYIGYIEDAGGALYPVFQADDFQGNGPAQFIGTGEPATTDTYAAGTIVTNMPFEIGVARFDNFAIFQGDGPAGTYQHLGETRTIPAGSYAAGDTEVGGETIRIPDQDGTPQAVEFVGYQTDTNYPIFKTVNQVNNEFINFLLTDEPSTASTVTLTAAEITTGAYTTCFAPGTLIATPHGERAVETLKPGDRVLTADGDVVPVRFVGFQKVPTLFGPGEQTLPVRIRAGALGRKVPHTDLVVTRDHGMIVDGVVCNAGALINGTSITEVPACELNADPKGVVTYYHVETEGHVPLLANGAVAESFIDNVGRETFTNHGEFVAMYGADVPPMTEMETPRAMSMRQVPLRIRLRLARRADIILAPPGVRRLWVACKGLVKCLFQERRLRDRARSARYRLARGLGIA